MAETQAVERPDPGVSARVSTRLNGPSPASSWLDWWGPVVAMLVGGLVRVWNVGTPASLVFDESYYVKQAYSMTQYGVELYVDPALEGTTPNAMFEAGTLDVFTSAGDLVVHPPLGKWLIAMGEFVLGAQNSYSWRAAAVIAGMVSILIVGRLARRLTGSAYYGTLAALLLAVEGTHVVVSRTGILDIFLMLFVLGGFACLVADRFAAREKLAWAIALEGGRSASALGPYVEGRWWRVGAGVVLGMAVATKWSALPFIATFGIMTVLWDMNARRRAGISRWCAGTLSRDAVPAFVSIVGSALLVYLLSWSGWFASSLGWGRQWADEHPAVGIESLMPNALRSLIHYHEEMWRVATSLSTEHPYATNPIGWFFQERPTLFFLRQTTEGAPGCAAGGGGPCMEMVTSLGTLSIWYAGAIAVVALLVLWIVGRQWRSPLWFQPDWTLGASLSGILAGYVPWLLVGERTIYSFYSVVFVPWVVLCIVVGLHRFEGRRKATVRYRLARSLGVALLVTSIVLLAWFWPVLTGQKLTHADWLARMWLSTWR
ncbi:phospholipid carrier-dependent glycosyltransferase [Tessaracoccus sp. MC1627]|uniref:dolichyl-phosphate-mannose--protein mannosyltransferase n=1 Tax=Tessaracoccus sp. MC1627 TaxID=2760312 RepID=UPI00160090EB|nr:phospholipid carrier-dependent glycosyltransferase [Tessaracoccus sp. MC1627]MBB1513759.1 phospholipid carrier-dependent glycosyltransferase [Tessaracoccus sp. MC1627]